MVVGLGLGSLELGMVGLSFWILRLRLSIRLLRRLWLWKSLRLLRRLWLWKSRLQLWERLRQCRPIQLRHSIEGSPTTTATHSRRLLSRVNRWSPRAPDAASDPRLYGGPRLHKLIRFPPWSQRPLINRIIAGAIRAVAAKRVHVPVLAELFQFSQQSHGRIRSHMQMQNRQW